jgi:uncharacterized protein HemX
VKRQSGSIALVFLIVLGLSLASNAALWHFLRGAQDERAAAEAKFDTQRQATEQCNASIDRLEQQAKQRDAENTELRKEAATRRRAQESLAQQILSTPATVPGDDCKSANDRVRNWLKGRKP